MKLYEFWKKNVTQAINEELDDDDLFLNLASNEYFKAIDTKALKVPVITAVFKDLKNGANKQVALWHKQVTPHTYALQYNLSKFKYTYT